MKDSRGWPPRISRAPSSGRPAAVTFAALGIPLIRGRLFRQPRQSAHAQSGDHQRNRGAALLAQRNPIGKRILSNFEEDQWSTIIGVVGDVKHTGLDAETNPENYYHYLQIPPEAMNFAESQHGACDSYQWRSGRDDILRARELRTLDPSLPVFNVHAMQDVIYGSVAQPRFRTLLISTFAGLALVLAALGLYGVVAYSVSQRTTELGIRMALGANRRSILQLVVFRAAGLAVIGLGIGIAISLAGSRLIRGFCSASAQPIQ